MEAKYLLPAMKKEIERSRESTAGILKDYTDGSVFKNECKNQEESDATTIDVFLFSDEAELCNSIGSSKTVQKILGIYFVIGNLRPMFRTRVENMQLLLINRSTYLKT
ncbi:hypothetical protein B566_EDAN016283 [Ephemera danica]|nr:hypothetical protein B566_EDAN016283 [Ephemera danica]